MRRILLLITDLQIGGTPTVVRELAVRLNRLPGVRARVACLAGWGPVAGQLHSAGVEVTALGARGARDVAVFRRLAKLIAGQHIDTVFSFLIHANMTAAMARVILAGRASGIRWIQSIQTTQPMPRWHWHLQRIVQAACEKVAVPSESVAIAAKRWAGIGGQKIVVIPNAIEPDEFQSSTADPAAIVFLGRLDPIKDVPTLLRAMAMLPGVTLEIYGEGADQPRIEAEIQRLNLKSSVTLHGAVARPQEALARAGMLVLPSLAEGFGLVLIEAMASGVPVVASDVAGIRDVVRKGETGLLFPAGDERKLADAMNQLMSDSAMRRRLIENAKADVARRFSWPPVLRQYCRLMELPDPAAIPDGGPAN